MKKVIKILCVFVLLCSFIDVNSKEKEEVILQSVHTNVKTDNVIENDEPILENNLIYYDLNFYDIGDSITYKVKIKNNTREHYQISSIHDNNTNPSIKYEYSYPDNDLKKGDTQTVYMKITYQDDLTSDSVLDGENVSHFEDNVKLYIDLTKYGLDDIINPKTNSTALIVYIIMFIGLMYLLVFYKKKKTTVSIIVLGVIFALYNVYAKDYYKMEIDIENDINIPVNMISNAWNSHVTGEFNRLVFSKDISIPNDAVDISEKQDGSIKGWINNNTMYFASKYKMYLPIDASYFFNRNSGNIISIDFGDDSISSRFTKNFSSLFSGLSQLEELDTSWITTDNATTLYSMFTGCSNLKYLDLSGFYNPDQNSISSVVGGCNSLEYLDLSNWKNNHTITKISFSGISNSLQELNVENFDTSHLSDMSYMFDNVKVDCILDLTTWDFSTVKTMYEMFYNASFREVIFGDQEFSVLININYIFGNANINKVKFGENRCPRLLEAQYMFYNANIGTADMGKLDFSSVESLYSLFYHGTFNKLKINQLDTSNVRNMQYVFSYVVGIDDLDLSSWNFRQTNSMNSMFYGSDFENITFGDIDSALLTDISYMFSNTYYLNNIEWNSFNTSYVTSVYYMFDGSNIEKIDLSKCDFNKVSSYENFVSGAGNLEEIILPKVMPTSSSFNSDLPGLFIDSDNNEYNIITSNLQPELRIFLKERQSILLNGQTLNRKLKRLAGNSSATYDSDDDVITGFVRTTTAPDLSQMTEANIISISSKTPVYAWIDNGVVYVYSEYEVIYMNATSTYMFNNMNALSSVDLSGFDTSKVTTLYYAFSKAGYNASSLSIDLSGFSFPKLTNMDYAFYYAGYNASSVNINISGMNTPQLTTLSYMFAYAGYSATTLNLNINNFYTSKITSITGMYKNTGYNVPTFEVDLSGFDFSSLTNASYLFTYAGFKSNTFRVNFSNSTTSKLINAYSMFSFAGNGATTFDVDVTNLNTSKVTSFESMFRNAGYYSTNWRVGNLSGWNTSNVTDMQLMFCIDNYLVSEEDKYEHRATTFNIGNLSNWNTSKVTNMQFMFSCAGAQASEWYIGDVSRWDVSEVTNMRCVFQDVAVENVDVFNIGNLSNWNVSKVTDTLNMFYQAGRHASEWYIGDLSNWNVSNVTTMSGMFGVTGTNADTWTVGNLSNWNTSKVTDMAYMFQMSGQNASNWSIGNLSNWNTSKVTNMRAMFEQTGLNDPNWSIGNLSNWDVSKVTLMRFMFYKAGYNATTFNIGNLSNWNTSKVTDMSFMFSFAGEHATTWNSIGTIKVYATDIGGLFYHTSNAKATVNIYTKPNTLVYTNDDDEDPDAGEHGVFDKAATASNALITVNYSSSVTNILDIINTKSENSNVVRGSQIS